MDNTGLILQARLGSTRLPQKMILPFYEGANILELLLDKLTQAFPDLPIILATSLNKENDVLEEISKGKGAFVFRGNENDVLLRYINAAEHYKISNIIRICGDNPFLDVKELSHLIQYAESTNFKDDYVSFQINNTPTIKTHFGFWAEFVKLEALKKVNSLTKDSLYHEHVTNYIYSHPDQFRLSFLDVTPKLKSRNDIRMTLDTKEDFNLLSEIYSLMVEKSNNHCFLIDDLIELIDTSSSYKQKMQEQILKNTK